MVEKGTFREGTDNWKGRGKNQHTSTQRKKSSYPKTSRTREKNGIDERRDSKEKMPVRV